MKILRSAVATVAALAALGAAPSPAAAGPSWDLAVRQAPSVLVPGHVGELTLIPLNTGDAPSTAPYSVRVTLPPGVTRVPPNAFDIGANPDYEGYDWTCTGSTEVTCQSYATVQPEGGRNQWNETTKGGGDRIYIRLAVAPGTAYGSFAQEFEVAGGGAPSAVLERRIEIGPELPKFGVEEGSFELAPYAAQKPSDKAATQANGHPFEMRATVNLNLTAGEVEPQTIGRSNSYFTTPVGDLRTVRMTLPKGLIGNPEAVPKCSLEDFMSENGSLIGTGCPPESQIGIVNLDIGAGDPYDHGYGVTTQYPDNFLWVPIYNLEPKHGVPADFGFNAGDARGHIYPTVDAANDYAIMAISPYLTSFLQVRRVEVAIWGVPGDPAHDLYRFDPERPREFRAEFNGPIRPLLTLSGKCGVPEHADISVDSWQKQEIFNPPVKSSKAAISDGCDDPRIRFEPEVRIKPTSTAASGPTGLAVNLDNPQRPDTVAEATDLYPENGKLRAIATPPIKKAVVTLPEGVTVSTSAAQGLGSCSSEQIGIGNNDPVRCPDSSQYGTLTVETPILSHPLEGRLYLASQYDNPFNSFLAMYVVVDDPRTGIVVKLPAKVELDQRTGQIKTSFDNLPEFPLESMRIDLKGGVRAALVNPSTCGPKTIRAELTSWSAPDDPVVVESSYDISAKADGSPCVTDPAQRPFAPRVQAGTVSPTAGQFSPFVFRLTRTDDDQEMSSIATKLPRGLIAKVAGITQCSEAQIAASDQKTGREEIASPSCPPSSYLGTADVGSGVGEVLTFIQAKAYLAGPYKGAPLSMVVISPVVAGPYDMGTVTVRTALDVDRTTAEVLVATDPFPQMFEGIPVRIKDIRIKIDRPEGTINPTSCAPKSIEATLGGVGGDLFSPHDDVFRSVSIPFQASDCASLGFKPSLSLHLKGGTKRGQFPAMVAKLRARRGDANFRSAQVTLPRTAFLEQGHIRTICTRVRYAAKDCPPGSVVGWARASSPLIDGELRGPVVMRSSNNKLPDLVATLNGIIEFSVSSRIDSKNQRIRATFSSLPDVPVSSFEMRMQGGRKGLIVNSADLCRIKSKPRALVRFRAQNGANLKLQPRVTAECKRKRGKSK